MKAAYVGAASAMLALVLVYGFLYMPGSAGPASSTTEGSKTQSWLGGNETVVATYLETQTVSSSTASTSSGAQSGGGGSWHYYTASSEVQVLSVSASVSTGGVLVFRVTYQNVGAGPIQVLAGGGSPLNVTVVSGSEYLKAVPSPRCYLAEVLVPVAPGANATAATPGCWSGYYYNVAGSGTIEVHLKLSWSTTNGAGSGAGSLVVDAQFSLG